MVEKTELTEHKLEGVLWREYDLGTRVYRIERPVRYWTREGGTTHRVQDAEGVVHIIPIKNTIIRYAKEPGFHPCLH